MKKVTLAVSTFFFVAAPKLCADIVIRWDASPNNRSVSCPAAATANTMTIRVNNINDIVYEHAIDVIVVATPAYPPSPIAQLNSGGNKILEETQTALDVLKTAYDSGFVPTRLADGRFANLPLATTVAAWRRIAGSDTWRRRAETIQQIRNLSNLTGPQEALRQSILADFAKLETAFAAIDGPNKKPNTLTTTVNLDLSSNNAITVKIIQTYGGEPVENGEQTFSCNVDTGAFTLSLGPIFSRIQARQYAPTAIPDGAGGTKSVLGVEYSRGLRPAGATLVNFLIPGAQTGPFSLYLTSGPTVKSSADDTSSFGWFAGASIALNKLLYISPGFHFGEFADFPRGYAEGTPIPTNAGTPTPGKRWTWRFAFAISYRVASFGSSEQKTPSPATSSPAAPADKTSPGGTPPEGGAAPEGGDGGENTDEGTERSPGNDEAGGQENPQ